MKELRPGRVAAEEQRVRRVLHHIDVECRDIAQRFEFPHFQLILRTMLPPGVPLQVLVDGAPPQFQALHGGKDDCADHPVFQLALDSVLPFELTESMVSDSAELRDSAAFLRDIQVPYGCVIPMHGPHSSAGMLTLMRRMPLPKSSHLREDLFRQLHWLGYMMFGQAITSLQRAARRRASGDLTSRQRSALALTASGHVLKDVARKLNVHRSTARYLVYRSVEKFGVRTWEEAIVRAVAFGEFLREIFPKVAVGSAYYFSSDAGDGESDPGHASGEPAGKLRQSSAA